MADGLVYTTALLLIANPTHNTALNLRKQLIRIQPSKLAPDQDIKFIAALFGSKQASKPSVRGIIFSGYSGTCILFLPCELMQNNVARTRTHSHRRSPFKIYTCC
jgi:hypothetical protein